MTALSMPVVWGITIAVLLVVEAATMGLTTIWFAGGALAALILAILHAPICLCRGLDPAPVHDKAPCGSLSDQE